MSIIIAAKNTGWPPLAYRCSPLFPYPVFSVLIRALPLLLRSRQPTKPYLDVLFDRLHRSLKSEAFTVEAQVIVAGICPLLPGVVTVEITAVLVGPLHKFLDVFSDVCAALNGLLDAVFSRCMDKYADRNAGFLPMHSGSD